MSGDLLSSLTQSGLAWFIFGVLLLILEISTPSFLAIFFAVGAWVTAILIWVGVLHGPWSPLAVFVVFSIASLLTLRKKLKVVRSRVMSVDDDTDQALDDFSGKTARVIEAIDPARERGRVEFRGSQWEARARVRIEAGETVRIDSRNNLTLFVKPVEE